eukprot:s3121_g10.t1
MYKDLPASEGQGKPQDGILRQACCAWFMAFTVYLFFHWECCIGAGSIPFSASCRTRTPGEGPRPLPHGAEWGAAVPEVVMALPIPGGSRRESVTSTGERRLCPASVGHLRGLWPDLFLDMSGAMRRALRPLRVGVLCVRQVPLQPFRGFATTPRSVDFPGLTPTPELMMETTPTPEAEAK